MKFLSLLKNNTELTSSSSSSSSWAWPSCHQPKTLSFRITTNTNANDTTSNKNDVVLLDSTPESFFTESPNSASFSTASEESRDPIETVIRGLRSDRLFFEPEETSSILEAAKLEASGTFHLLAVDSKDPYVDFRESMEEMVETHGVKDWESLEELLYVYLKVNVKSNHGYIVGAFVDLLVGLALGNDNNCGGDNNCSGGGGGCSLISPSPSPSSYSPLLLCSFSSLSSLEGEEEVKVGEEITPKDEASSSFDFY